MRRYLKNVKLRMDCPALGMAHPVEPVVMHRGEHDVGSTTWGARRGEHDVRSQGELVHHHEYECEHGSAVMPATFPPHAYVDTALRMSAMVEGDSRWASLWV